MSGIAGIVNPYRKIDFEAENIQKMTVALTHRGQKIRKIKNDEYGVFGCTAFEYVADKERQIPLSVKSGGCKYTICFDGLIYNVDELKTELKSHIPGGENPTDAELCLAAFIRWGAGCLQRLNGIFAFVIWNSGCNELFLARDRFGIKPLYYTIRGDVLIFASEIKGILAHPDVPAVLDKTGVCEVMGLGPAQTRGCGIFAGINEIMPGHCATFNRNGFKSSRYWSLASRPYECSFEECLEETRKLTFNAINSQLEGKGRDMCFFLSGGLDSSAIVALAAQKYGEGVNTFSLQYSGNDEFFTPTEYQPTSDDYFITLMSEQFGTRHRVVTVDNDSLYGLLYDAMKARDLPGMADVDSSLYFLCREMGSEFNGALSGECGDEIFGGYPWFHRNEDFEANIFPWAKNIDLRKNLISPKLLSPDEISEYIYSKYNKSIEGTPVCRSDSKEEARRREISHLNIEWFMYTLGARSERIGMNCGLEIRMPFCDHKLVEYMWNVPWEFKAHKGREKGLLRMVFDEVLPEDVLWRKKSPFPKTHNPGYEVMVRDAVKRIFDDKNSPVLDLVNTDYVSGLMNTSSDYSKPWFGQLMATPQLYAYIIQLDMWLREYNIQIKL